MGRRGSHGGSARFSRSPEGLPSEAAAQRHSRTATINSRDSSIGPKSAAASESDRRHTQGIEPNARRVRERYPPGYASRGSNASLDSPRTVAASEWPRHRNESDCQNVFHGNSSACRCAWGLLSLMIIPASVA
ncbi:unnamed protein product [Ixodes pacificus]